jgi:preprotein translocase subunit YajC
LIDIANAMSLGGGAQQGAGGFGALVPLILMFVIFYFLLIRPQQKKTKEHKQLIQDLKKGDRIITGGGIHGRVTGVDETTLTVEIADKVRVKVNRSNVAGLLQPTAKEQPSKK